MHRFTFIALVLVSLSDVAVGARLNLEKLRQETGVHTALSLEEYRAKHADIVEVDVRFLDFGKVIDWAKNEAKDILKMIEEETAETVGDIKAVVAAHVKNFKTLLGETREKCAQAVRELKDQLVTGLKGLKDTAAAELPKFFGHFDGLKAKLAQARDALTAQLLSGSLAGAGEVIQQHMTILLEEAKTVAEGPLKTQILASAGLLKGQLTTILKSTFDSGKTKFTDTFSQSFEDATVLVHKLIAEVKAELAADGKEVAGQIAQGLKESGQQLVDGVKTGAFAPDAAPAGLLQMSSVQASRAMLESQLQELSQAAQDLAGAAMQSATSQTEQTVDVATSLGERVGRFAMELFNKQLTPQLIELKQKAMRFLEEKLDQLREWVFKSANTAVAELSKINAFAGQKAKELLDKYGPKAEAWSQELQDRLVDTAEASLNIEKARDALQAALDKGLTKRAGELQAKIVAKNGQDDAGLRTELASLEQEIHAKREGAYKAKQAAATALEGLAARCSEAVGRIKAAMQSALSEGNTALAAELKALEEHSANVWSVAMDYGREARNALKEASAALLENKEAGEGWTKLVDIGVQFANTIFKNNGSGQCQKSAHRFCCGWGKPCDCSKDSKASGQCSYLSYKACCEVGTPCDCSKPAK